tara:strand:- start:28 stop:180 length:153 start_codon:yes stop_codon:yes gene_type:complete
MINTLIKIKLLKITLLSGVVGGVALGLLASKVNKELCRKKKLEINQKKEE